MVGLNLIVVYNSSRDKILMCKRKKEPYLGLCNFVGGHIESGESGFEAAYRELSEETGITENDIKLTHLMDYNYPLSDCYLEVYAGRLFKDIIVNGDENELFWSDLNHNFFDMNIYAGEGSIGHILCQIDLHSEDIL
jgi:ADP-ribose pyrophosphatase